MKKLLGTVALVGMLMAPSAVSAQTTIGGVLGYHDDFDALGIGAYAAFALPQLHENISINPSFMYYFPDGFDAWEVNGDLVYAFPVSADSPITPFALAGINIMRVSFDAGVFGSASSTDVGLNLGGGVTFPMEGFTPFAGAKFEIQDGTGFLIFGGAGFAVGG
ncbi:MAG: hypothetical protein OEO79_16705 [Gemmatimonadota bacterium]|nr:hypothetical protein [Gemmatimonadota bacterium]MDH3421595.1 hypothetical protein [Gemmatimonadota bacterium]